MPSVAETGVEWDDLEPVRSTSPDNLANPVYCGKPCARKHDERWARRAFPMPLGRKGGRW